MAESNNPTPPQFPEAEYQETTEVLGRKIHRYLIKPSSGFAEFITNAATWILSFSSRSLELTSIVLLHIMFIPATLAYLNGLTDQLPGLDTYLLALAALLVMLVRGIINNDRVANLLHAFGFVSQLTVVAMILLK